MCTVAIVDTNVLTILAPKRKKRHNQDPVLCEWIRQRHGILAYSKRGKYSSELRHSQRIWRIFREYRRGQQAALINDAELCRAEERLKHSAIRSNDKHLIELAMASNALVLCSDDKKLKKDFVDVSILPNIGERTRVVYPIKATEGQRRSFLRSHECPNRKIK